MTLYGTPKTDTTLIFTPNKNHTRKDYSIVFKPEAKRFCDYWDLDRSCIHEFDISGNYESRKAEVYKVIEEHGKPLDTLVFFCHGFPNGLQCGIKRPDLPVLCKKIAALPFGDNPLEINVILYCCSTGDVPGKPKANEKNDGPGMGDNSFADRFRDELCKAELEFCTVWGHTTRGHSTRNPYMRVFYGEGSPLGGVGGRFPVSPKSELWREWKRALWSSSVWESTDWGRKNFRFAFPVLGFDGFCGSIHEALIDKKVIVG